MIQHRMTAEENVHAFLCSDPFSFAELITFMGRFARRHDTSLPFVFDLRAVDMTKFTSHDFRQHIDAFKVTVEYQQTNRCVYLVRDSTAIGMLRMYVGWSSASGLRDDRLALVTDDIQEATDWVAEGSERTGTPDIAGLLET